MELCVHGGMNFYGWWRKTWTSQTTSRGKDNESTTEDDDNESATEDACGESVTEVASVMSEDGPDERETGQ